MSKSSPDSVSPADLQEARRAAMDGADIENSRRDSGRPRSSAQYLSGPEAERSLSDSVLPSTAEASEPQQNEEDPQNTTEAIQEQEGYLLVSSANLTVLTVFATLCMLYAARAVLIPITMALLLSLTLRPFVRRCYKNGVPESVTAILSLGALVLLLLVGLGSVLEPGRRWVESAPQQMQGIQKKLSSLTERWSKLSSTTAKVQEMAVGGSGKPPMQVELHESPLLQHVALATNTGNVLGNLLVVLVLSFFMLTSGDALLNQVLSWFDRMSDKKKTVELVHEVQRGISTYLLTVTAINAGLGVISGVGFWLLGMPNAALWGALTFAMNYIPFFGPAVCSLIIILVSVLSFDSIWYAMVPPTYFIVVSAIEGNLVTPIVLGKSMSLNPVVVFVALLIGGWAWGLGGAFLAVPTLAVIKIAMDKFPSTQRVSQLLSA